MKSIVTTGLICLLTSLCFGQNVKAFKDKNTAFIGFKNAKDEIIIPATKYEEWKGASDENGNSADYPDGYFKGYDCRSEAFDARNNVIEQRKAKDLETYRTYFSQKCN